MIKELDLTKNKTQDTPDIIVLGDKAEEVLKNDAFIVAFDMIETSLFEAWRKSAPAQEKEREHIYYRLEGLAYIKTKLQGMLNNMKAEKSKKIINKLK